MYYRPLAVLALALLTGCPKPAEKPTQTPPPPPPSGAPTSDAPPRVTDFGEILPEDEERDAKDKALWDALITQYTGWARLVPGMLKDEAKRANLEAPFLADKAAADKLALLTRTMPVYDDGAGHVMRLTGPLARHLKKAGAGLESFGVDDPKTVLWLVLMDPRQVQRTRWLKTKSGWKNVPDEGFDRSYSKSLREGLYLAHAGRWTEALPHYTSILKAIAKTSSERHSSKALAAWNAVEGAWPGDQAALETALEAWWQTFTPSKEKG